MNLPWSIGNDRWFVQHAANDQWIVGSLHETMYLLNRETRHVWFLDCFYGDPTCAIVAENEQWILMGGDHLSLYDIFKGHLSEIDLPWVFAMRQTDTWKAEILTDPWHEDAAVWAIDVQTKELHLSRRFPDYIDQPYTEDVIW
ncbi:hypothetical protein [Chitinophaga varians]|uniref:hypothetical protein n=1 Tax=Chitinophaga varians TaxID=2202339 RepID=UPI00165F77D6|nr:hypothetical protein [Chitinophaga varians]MBC9909529.1 hypothetical protein [Chitinophaga varians]